MGQIIGSAAKPKRCNINQLSQFGTPAAGEHILVSSDNSMNAAGQGNFDCYIEGDGTKAATELELKSVDTLIGVFDISAYHATGDVLAKYADLSAALDGGSNIPEAIRKGGMPVKFVQSSDNKYVQFRLMATSFSTTESDWQGVDDVPTAGSDNLVKSGGVLSGIKGNPQLNYYVCETAGDNYQKSVTIPGFDLSKSNSFFYIKFLYAHTDTAHDAMLSINGDSYRYILFEETRSTKTWKDGEILRFYYDGTNYRANRVDFNYRIESIVSAYKDILGEPLDFTIQGFGFYRNNLVVEANITWIRGFVDVSNYSSQTIRLLAAIRGDAKIIIAGVNDTIIHTISGSETSNIYDIDLSLYSGAKRIYFCSEANVVRYPYAAINLATTPINEIEENINELNNLLVSEHTVSTPNAGYIDHSGNIAGETSTWKHSDIFPVGQFYSAIGFIGHGTVSSFAFYGTNAISSADNNFKGYWDVNSQAGLIDKETFNSHVPTGANYFVCSTNTASATLQLKLVSNVLDDLQSDIEDIESSLETISGQVETNTDDIAELKSSVRAAVVSDKMLHVSFDDTINAFRDLVQNSRASIFSSPFFSTLKTLHDTYGVVFSCYCFYDLIDLKYVSNLSTITNPSATSIYYLSAVDEEYSVGYYVWRGGQWVSYNESTMRDNYVLFSLSDMTNTYAAEFTAAKDWLKFGFHSLDSTVVLSNVSASDAKDYYDDFIEDIVRITGTVETIDMVPRLQSFAGTIDVCRALRDCDCGCLGFLTADYSETSGGQGGQSQGYYLTSPAPVVLWNKGQWYDYQERLHFYPSSLRLDGQTATATETYMNKFLTVAKYGQSEMICMYCHENQMFVNGSVGSNYVASLTNVAEWAVAHGYLFGYPMNRIRASF